MTASLELANQGFECFLIDRSEQLGGNTCRLYSTLERGDLLRFLKELIQKVEVHKLIHIYKNAEAKDIFGYAGNFKTTVLIKGKENIFEHGVITKEQTDGIDLRFGNAEALIAIIHKIGNVRVGLVTRLLRALRRQLR
jgi:heterodisulfide reductase subunit A-like polyferredoxin